MCKECTGEAGYTFVPSRMMNILLVIKIVRWCWHRSITGKLFNTFGIFYPVILYNGKIVGNWNKSAKKKRFGIESSFFIPGIEVDEESWIRQKKGLECLITGEMTDAGSVEMSVRM